MLISKILDESGLDKVESVMVSLAVGMVAYSEIKEEGLCLSENDKTKLLRSCSIVTGEIEKDLSNE